MSYSFSDPGALADLALGLTGQVFRPNVAIAATDPRIEYAALAEELNSLPNAVNSRRMEFVAGRAAARRAMHQLGLSPMATLHGEDRAPIWPDGITGSISHTKEVCVAAVSRTGSLQSIGLDLEDATPLDAELIPIVCAKQEQAWLDGLVGYDKYIAAKVIFAAKECAYKAQYPLSQALFGFDTIAINISQNFTEFRAHFLKTVAPFEAGETLNGQIRVQNGLIVAAIEIPS